LDEVAAEIAQRSLAELEELVGPASPAARDYSVSAWSDWLCAASQWPCALAEITKICRLRAARQIWDTTVRPGRRPHQGEAARRLGLGSPQCQGWLVFRARRQPIATVTPTLAGTWARQLHLCDPDAHPDDRTSEQRVRRRAAGRVAALHHSGDLSEVDPLETTLELLHVAGPRPFSPAGV
jgi:hypothetical protein